MRDQSTLTVAGQRGICTLFPIIRTGNGTAPDRLVIDCAAVVIVCRIKVKEKLTVIT
jgi:hypothetical protein